MTNQATKTPKNGSKTQWQTWALTIVALVIASFLAVQWQTAVGNSNDNEKAIMGTREEHDLDVAVVVTDHEADIARLDESNRNRRNQIADLEERIARIEERTSTP